MGDACIESYGCDVYPDTQCDNGDDDENNDITSLNFPARYPLLIAFAPLLLVDVDAPAKSTRGRPEQIVYSGFSGWSLSTIYPLKVRKHSFIWSKRWPWVRGSKSRIHLRQTTGVVLIDRVGIKIQ